MFLKYGGVIVACVAAIVALPASANDVEKLRQEVEQVKRAYESRIEALEKQLEQVQANQSKASTAEKTSGLSSRTISFNPNISVVVDGAAYTDSVGGEGSELANEAFRASQAVGHSEGDEEGHGHGGFERGFNLREVEIGVGASVDPFFDAQAYMSISTGGGFELEEAYARTLALPAGFQLKFGKFFSNITRHNAQHPHEWDWADQNLPYQNLFGAEGNLRDVGVQLTWVPPTPFFSKLGVEVLQGEQSAFGAFVDDGDRESAAATIDAALGNPGVDAAALGLSGERSAPRLFTGFARIGPDLGPMHALQLGLWGAYVSRHQEIQELEEPDEALVLQGDGYMWGADATYKYGNGRAGGRGDVVLQAEYIRQQLDTRITFSAEDPSTVGQSRELVTDGLYLQGWYGVWPQWRLGARYEVLGMTNETRGPTTSSIDDSSRFSLAVTWVPTEFSRFRLQGNFADITSEDGSTDFDSVFLQYSLTYGAHPAHKF